MKFKPFAKKLIVSSVSFLSFVSVPFAGAQASSSAEQGGQADSVLNAIAAKGRLSFKETKSSIECPDVEGGTGRGGGRRK
jgi:hypothetical protein